MNILKTLIIASLLIASSTSFANDEKAGTGTVMEVLTVKSYVYVRLEEDDTWVASSTIPVVVGDKVKYSGSNAMKNFSSSSLNRTFENILFAGKLEVINEFNADAHAKAVESNDNHQNIKKNVAAVAPIAGEIAPLEGGKTIAAINTEYAQLKDQSVSLRAKVMKVSLNVLGKNWITLQDGTGTKLLATTLETVEIGDVVTVKGVIRNDIDLGSGYKYKVVMEEAAFSK